MADPIEDYIRANRAGYRREAVTEALIAAGQDPGAVEAAWDRVSLDAQPPAPAPGQSQWRPPTGAQPPAGAPGMGQANSQGAILVRSYRAKSQADAARRFEADAARMAVAGYFPISQSWAQGQWGCGAFLVALLLAIVLIGILIFIYLLVVKPDGTLTVTYQYRPPTA